MSTSENSGQASEQRPEPTDAAGCKSEVDRSVQGTGLPGFAELRARAIAERDEAAEWITFYSGLDCTSGVDRCKGQRTALGKVLRWLDDIEADAKDASKAGERISTSEAVP